MFYSNAGTSKVTSRAQDFFQGRQLVIPRFHGAHWGGTGGGALALALAPRYKQIKVRYRQQLQTGGDGAARHRAINRQCLLLHLVFLLLHFQQHHARLSTTNKQTNTPLDVDFLPFPASLVLLIDHQGPLPSLCTFQYPQTNMRSAGILALAASLSTASATVYKGFNYGATKSDGYAPRVQSDFESLFQTSKNLVGATGFTSARLYTTIVCYASSMCLCYLPLLPALAVAL